MPRLEEIEQFKSELNALGHEPSILAQRGEQLEDVALPDSSVDADLDALLNADDEDDGEPIDSIDPFVGDEESDDEEFFSPDTGEDIQPPASEEDDDFSIPEDLLAGFDIGEEDETEGAAATEGDEEDDFSLPAGLFDEGDDSDASVEDEFAIPDEAETADDAFAFPAEEESPDEEFALPDEGFDLPTGEEASGEEFEFPDEAEPSDEEFAFPDEEESSDEEFEFSAEEEAADDEFALPDEGDEGFDLPTGEEAGDDEFAFPAGEESSDEEFAFPDGAEPSDDDFTFPDEAEPSDDDFAFPAGEESPDEEFSLPAEGDEGFDLPAGEESSDEEFAFPAGEEAASDEDEFQIPEEFAAAADILSMDEEPEEPEEAAEIEDGGEAAAGEEELGFEGGDFALPEEFSMDQLEDDFEDMPAAEAEEETVPEEFAAEEDFSLPDEFEAEEDFSLPEEAGAEEEAGEESVPEEMEFEPDDEELSFSDEDAGSADFSMPEGFPFEESGAGEEEDFSLPEGGAETGEEMAFGDDFDIPSAGDIEDIDENNFEVDEFSLGDLGEQFGEIEEGPPSVREEDLNPAVAVSEEIPAGEDELELDDEQFGRLQHTLNQQPLNLRIAIEELIGEKNLAGVHLQKLVDALVEGASPKELAALVGQITGKKIKIPTRYEKSSGAEFEAERGTFAYLFRQNILPILKVMALGVVVLGILTYLTMTFIYRPIHALILYNSGYRQLEEDSFREANLYFDNAVDEWRFKDQYFRYAEGFQEKRQFGLAAEKYEQLLEPVIWRREGVLERRPGVGKIGGKERQALIDYARMETDDVENFEHSEELLDVVLGQEKHDYDALLAAGDNYLAWGEYEYERYEDARRSYATLIQYHGAKYELLFRMLRYFIRVDNYDEVARLKEQFEADQRLTVEPDAYAELGGYLIDRNDLDDVRDVLTRAMEVDETVPEIHYNLARYFRRIENEAEERKALDFAEYWFEQSRPLGRKRLRYMIDTYDRQGEVDYEDGEYLTAEEYLLKARETYEEALDRRILEPEAIFGRIYRNLGNLYYYVAAEFDTALEMFETAEANGYRSAGVSYRKGYIHYNNGRYRDALAEFSLAAGDYSVNENLLFATGNALFERSDYFAAQGYYTHLLDELEQRRRNISVLLPRERDEDRSLIDRLIRVNNNLGVTLQRLSLASGDRQKFSRALVHLTDSTEYFDLLSRDPESMERGSAVNLGYLNQRAMLYPVENYELQIYADIPLDLETLWME